MFQVEHVQITGFWGKHTVEVELHPDVNIFIGRNGSGKTTFINLLQAVLRVDLRVLATNDFESITIRLGDQGRTRTIRVLRERTEGAFDALKFKVGTRSWTLPLYAPDYDLARQYRVRPRRQQEFAELKTFVDQLIRVASLSVHRTGAAVDTFQEDDYVSRRRHVTQPPIDQRLDELIQQLTSYQLTLAESAGEVSARFQKDVLASMLYDADFDKFDLEEAQKVSLGKEKDELSKAYKELGVLDPEIARRIDKHIDVLKRSLANVRKKDTGILIDDIMPLPLLRRTQHIIKLSLAAENDKQEVFQPVRRFVQIISRFISDKRLQISARGDLEIHKDGKPILSQQLSSGEKQLLILLTETLLQKNEPFVFIADEPELSLHIEWQEKVISSIKELNARAQVILATHSPEITAGWKQRVFDMESVVRG
jgi:predicted ATP-dependent endonuclease of OLD family